MDSVKKRANSTSQWQTNEVSAIREKMVGDIRSIDALIRVVFHVPFRIDVPLLLGVPRNPS